MNQAPYNLSRELEAAIGEFVEFYIHRRYHKALRDITPTDMLVGRREEILGRRREVKDRTINRRRPIEPRPQGATRNGLISLLPNPSHFAEAQLPRRGGEQLIPGMPHQLP